MKWKMRKCQLDGIYTFSLKCPTCGGETVVPHPPRFSPIDRYVKYRIQNRVGKKVECLE